MKFKVLLEHYIEVPDPLILELADDACIVFQQDKVMAEDILSRAIAKGLIWIPPGWTSPEDWLLTPEDWVIAAEEERKRTARGRG